MCTSLSVLKCAAARKLRKVFLDDIKHDKWGDAGHREYHSVDAFVYEICKLFGCNDVQIMVVEY